MKTKDIEKLIKEEKENIKLYHLKRIRKEFLNDKATIDDVIEEVEKWDLGQEPDMDLTYIIGKIRAYEHILWQKKQLSINK